MLVYQEVGIAPLFLHQQQLLTLTVLKHGITDHTVHLWGI